MNSSGIILHQWVFVCASLFPQMCVLGWGRNDLVLVGLAIIKDYRRLAAAAHDKTSRSSLRCCGVFHKAMLHSRD